MSKTKSFSTETSDRYSLAADSWNRVIVTLDQTNKKISLYNNGKKLGEATFNKNY